MEDYNFDEFKIKNWEIIEPEGFLKIWIVGGVPNYELEYDGRPNEIIYEDELFNRDSLNTAVGKPLSLNHPPKAIVRDNYKEFIGGAILQEFVKDPDTKALTMAAMVYDSKIIEGITNRKYNYVSSGYKAEKIPNNDGILVQKNRNYNHFAVLDENYQPRAGVNSKVHMTGNKDSEATITTTTPPTEQPVPETGGVVTPAPEDKPVEPTIPVTPPPTLPPITTPETPTPVSEPSQPDEKTQADSTNMIQITKDELESRVELLTTWKPVLDKNKKSVSFNSDSATIKKEILSIFYTPSVLKQVNESNLDGFWLGFITSNNDAQAVVGNAVIPQNSGESSDLNFDSTVDSLVDTFTKRMEGKKP